MLIHPPRQPIPSAPRWAVAAALLLAACDGGTGPGGAENFAVQITTPAVVNETVAPGTPVQLTAEGLGDGAPVADGSRYEWRVHAAGAYRRGNPITAVLEPGPNSVVVSLKDEAGREVARDSTIITVPRDTLGVKLHVACAPALLRGTELPAECLTASITHNPRGYTPVFSWRLEQQNEVSSPGQLPVGAVAGDRRVYVLARVQGGARAFLDSVRVAVRDTLQVTGQMWGVTPGGAVAVEGWRVHTRVGGVVDSAAVAADGSFSITSRGVVGDSADVWLEMASDGERAWHPAWMRLSEAQARQPVRVALVPRSWTLSRGTFAGETVPVSLDVLMSPAAPGDLFYFPRDAVAWEPGRMPIPVAFAHDSSDTDFVAADSVRVWAALENLMTAEGVRYFAPARQDVQGPVRVLMWMRGNLGSLGAATRASGSWNDYLTEGRVWFLNPTAVSAVTTDHEIRHVLGVGHTCAFPSVMKPIGICPPGGPHAESSGTRWDVAYMQLLQTMHAEQRRLNARHGLAAGVAGERILMLGQPAPQVMANIARIPLRVVHPSHPHH